MFSYQAYLDGEDASVGSVEVWQSGVVETRMMNLILLTCSHSCYCCDTAGYRCVNLQKASIY